MANQSKFESVFPELNTRDVIADSPCSVRFYEFSWNSPHVAGNEVTTIPRRVADILQIQSNPCDVHLADHSL